MVVYDVTDRESFNAVKKWMGEIKKYTQPDVLRILVGNKSDLGEKREVKSEEGLNLANFYGIQFIETSAKDTTNISEAFLKMSKNLVEKLEKGGDKNDESTSEATRLNRNQESKGCCGR